MTPDYSDRSLGYFYPLNTQTVEWLASEVRMLHVQRDRETRERLEAEARFERDRASLRHILAHQAAATVTLRISGKYRQEGAAQIVEMLWPVSKCPPECDGREDSTDTIAA
jgi:hypothetical protein